LEGFASTVTLGQGQIKALEGLEQSLPIAWAAQAERNQIGFCLFWITRLWAGRQAAPLESFALLVIRGKGLTLRCECEGIAFNANNSGGKVEQSDAKLILHWQRCTTKSPGFATRKD
jgi:hypothetical protein